MGIDRRKAHASGHPVEVHARPATGCAYSSTLRAKGDGTFATRMESAKAALLSDADGYGSAKKCHQLNGENLVLDRAVFGKALKTNVPDVRFQYIVPNTPCNPCDVSYSISAKIDED